MTPTEFRIKNFLKRIPPSAPPAVARNVETAFRLADRFKQKAIEVRSDEKRSVQGKREQLLVMASGGFAGHWGQLQREADRALTGIAGEIGGLRKRARDSLGEFASGLQREVRDYLRSLNDNDRQRLVIETQDPLVLSSILAAPAFLSGLNAEIYDHVEARVVENAFGARLKELEIEHAAWENASAACQVAANEISNEAGITAEGFKKLAAPPAQSEAA